MVTDADVAEVLCLVDVRDAGKQKAAKHRGHDN